MSLKDTEIHSDRATGKNGGSAAMAKPGNRRLKTQEIGQATYWKHLFIAD